MVVLPKYDEFFKGIFRNETVRRHFIGDVLGISQEDIRCVELKNTFLWKRCWRQKLGILDVVLELNGSRKVNIELQVKPVKDWDKRQLFYLSRLYSEELGVGGKYIHLKKCVGISILDFNLTDRKEYHSVYRLRDQKGHEFSDVLEVHVIELKKELTGHGELEDWIRFFNVKREEDLKMIKTKNPGILEAIGELGEGWVAEETLAIAIYCSLKYSNDFDKALIASVNHSGDSDSTGAVTGNILGAYLGLKGIPQKYLEHLELKNVIIELANDLYKDYKMAEYAPHDKEIWKQKYIYKTYQPNYKKMMEDDI